MGFRPNGIPFFQLGRHATRDTDGFVSLTDARKRAGTPVHSITKRNPTSFWEEDVMLLFLRDIPT